MITLTLIAALQTSFMQPFQQKVDSPASGSASLQSIYGELAWFHIYQLDDPSMRRAIDNVGMLFKRSKSVERLANGWKFKTRTLAEFNNLCSDSVFASDQDKFKGPVDTCSGFLITPTLFMTAGHCFVGADRATPTLASAQGLCSDMSVTFDYQASGPGSSNDYQFTNSQMFHCKRVLYINPLKIRDFAVIELDRPTGRPGLKFSNGAIPTKEDGLMGLFGHPMGLNKFLAKGVPYDLGKFGVRTDFDGYHGFSGGAVLNENAQLAGIFIQGAQDFRKDETRGCKIENFCDQTPDKNSPTCSGEFFTPTQRLLPELIQNGIPFQQ